MFSSVTLLKLISNDYEFQVFTSSLLKNCEFLSLKFIGSNMMHSFRPNESNWNWFTCIMFFLGEFCLIWLGSKTKFGKSSKIIELVSFFLNNCFVFEKAFRLNYSENVGWVVDVSLLVFCYNLKSFPRVTQGMLGGGSSRYVPFRSSRFP